MMWCILLLSMTGAFGYLVTLSFPTTRRVRKTREVFLWLMLIPAAFLILMALFHPKRS